MEGYFFVGNYGKRPDGNVVKPNLLNREEIEALRSCKDRGDKAPTPIIPGAYSSGKVEQVTDYEKIAPNFWPREADQFMQEQFIGEQVMVFESKGRGWSCFPAVPIEVLLTR